jgi:hypothetical protein
MPNFSMKTASEDAGLYEGGWLSNVAEIALLIQGHR